MSIITRFVFTPIFLLLLFTNCSSKKNGVEVISPNKKYEFLLEVVNETSLTYQVNYNGSTIIQPSNMEFEFSDDLMEGANFEIDKIEESKVNSSWKPPYGELSEYPEVYSESLVKFKKNYFDLRIRAYNEGVAFRYEFKNTDGNLNIKNENTEFKLSSDATVWSTPFPQEKIEQSSLSAIKDSVERPLLVQIEDSLFAALGEASLVDYAQMKFIGKGNGSNTLVTALRSEVTSDGSISTPWRYIMAGSTAGEILENNYLLLNLNEPNKIDDLSWIKPGKVIREVTLTTTGGKACVDFAAKHNLQYVEFDAGWYGNEYDTASDATTITVDPRRSKGPLDLLNVIEYAKSKDVGIILYVNRRSLEKQIDEVLPLLKSWGVAGVKYGFVNVGSQKWTKWLHDGIRKAADHQLMVDVHDNYRPTGYSRTYPNLLTQEGIRGDEESPGLDLITRTIFTRMIAGAGDQTNCYFADRISENKMGTRASQMAKSICIYSPWQFVYWYDRPEGSPINVGGAGTDDVVPVIKEIPDLSFYDNLPTSWDDTKVLEGYPGEYAVIARKKGKKWFLGALNAKKNESFDLKFGFLDEDVNYEAVVYTHDESLNTPTKINIKKIKVVKGQELSFDIPQNDGLAIIISPVL